MKDTCLEMDPLNEENECVVSTEFKHYDQVIQLLSSIKSETSDLRREETLENTLIQIFNFYLEQPHLLDPYLEKMLLHCLEIVKSSKNDMKSFHFTFRILYLMIKTRGYKSVVRLMPHTVDEIEPTLSLLSEQNLEDSEHWQTRYVLLLWLSILIMVPFSLDRLDSADKPPIVQRVITLTKCCLNQDERTQEAAAFLLGRIVTRPDVIQIHLPEVVSWALNKIKEMNLNTSQGQSQVCGILRTLANICKIGQRVELLPHAVDLLAACLQLSAASPKAILVSRLRTKLIQRIGLLFCPRRIAIWQYQRGCRSLKDNLESRLSELNNQKTLNAENFSTHSDMININSKVMSETEEMLEVNEDFELSNAEEVAEVIDQLINSLRSQYTVVRWSAAKGLGRICARLSSSMVDDVLCAISALCTRLEPYTAWHGACLALAELGRRSLLLPCKLPEVIPIVLRALFYDERSGDHNYGSNVRDAACYVCWAFARAYHPKDFKAYSIPIASSLILVSLFDREVNVRRAGAAAFQENVGRQGQFPHGIDILTACDYFSVGNRSACYLQLSLFVAKFDEYIQPMIDHLVEIRLGHWDDSIRFLAARALNHLCPFNIDYMQQKILPQLINISTKSTLHTQQGSIFGIAEIICALVSCQRELSPEILLQVKEIIPILLKNNKFRGLSGELMRKAACHLIEKCSIAKLPFNNDSILEVWREFLDGCVEHKNLEVQTAAITAYSAFLTTYLFDETGDFKSDYRGQFVTQAILFILLSHYYCWKAILYKNVLTQLDTNVENKQAGYLKIINSSPIALYTDHVNELFEVIINLCRITSKNKSWIDARGSGLKALVSIVKNLGPNHAELNVNLLNSICPVLLCSLADYTVDSRGDIGSHVREVGMECLELFLDFLITNNVHDLMVPDVIEEIIVNIVQQAVEKIDRTRSVAGRVFANLLHHDPPIPHFPHVERLKQIFPKSDCDEMNWGAANVTFSRFIELLDLPEFRYRLILGLTVSVGGLTELTVRCSTDALTNYLLKHESDHEFILEFVTIINRIFTIFSHDERIVLPLFKFMDFLLNDPIVSSVMEKNLSILLHLIENTWNEIKQTKDIHLIKAAIDVFGGMLQFDNSVCKRTLSILMVCLGHRYPVIRKATATKIYECLMIYELTEPENLNSLLNLLTETIWESDLEVIRPIRNQVCELLKLPVPTRINNKSNELSKNNNPKFLNCVKGDSNSTT